VLWFKGMAMLPLLSGWTPLGRHVISLALLATVPWWADYFPHVLGKVDARIAGVLADMLEDTGRTDRIVAADEPALATLAAGKRLNWTVDDSVYRDTFGQLRFTAPSSPFPTVDAALAAIASMASAQVGDMTDEARATLFANFERYKRRDLRAVGIVFLPAARDALRDGIPSVARAAHGFLDAWTTQPVETPDPRDADYAERLELQRAVKDSSATVVRAAH
jgi:hypothetical protein